MATAICVTGAAASNRAAPAIEQPQYGSAATANRNGLASSWAAFQQKSRTGIPKSRPLVPAAPAPSRNLPRSARLACRTCVVTLPGPSGMLTLSGGGPDNSYRYSTVTSTLTGRSNFSSDRHKRASSPAWDETAISSRAKPAVRRCLSSNVSAYSQLADSG